ncbi:transcription initiation factor TFIID subunit 3 isoform X1 [Nasonia vitripennis]|uniref:PHD-type domain-containing protein n=2 Tax=Nasonia vitripennis TaxID=7425 RepID=A0A7M7TAV4_NASVI|nr:transcription initiation factor TFIID subunit 3 isoform X1 [Nasonia vitripennis]XP_031787835.1 transcription initiation factor TFIID subunit 3 isoform X1 [Nasonia vitripennis]
MTTEYTRNVLKMVVAQICQTVGWHSINSTPLEFMVDLMQEYIFQVSKLTQQYAQVLGRCDANLDDLGLAFRHMNIDLQELAEYVKNVDSIPCVVSVPKLPIHRESHLNFLKPGSREVVTRPVHVHEHLPAMYPGTEEEYLPEIKTEDTNSIIANEPTNISEDDCNEMNVVSNGISNDDSPSKTVVHQNVFKRPGDPVTTDGPVVKRAKTTEEGRPLREIHSVMMTTSGFLSTAREGKLPEARTPQQAKPESPPPPAVYPMVPPAEVKVEKKLKKIPKKMVLEGGKPENKENKKKKIPKDTLFKPDEIKVGKVKKLAGMKEQAKSKALKPGSKVSTANLAGPSNQIVTGKLQGKVPVGGSPKHVKSSKIKAEKVDIDMGLVANNPLLLNDRKEEAIIKLPIEPDKQKLNIFKKITPKSKEDKEMLDVQQKFDSRENFSAFNMEYDKQQRNDLVKQEDKKPIVQNIIVNNNVPRVPEDVGLTDMMSPNSDTYMFDMSPPGTPRTPKTPELSLPAHVPLEKKKKKDKTGKKKEPKQKIPKNNPSPKKARLSNDSAELSILDRPKTPQAPEHSPTRDSKRPAPIPGSFFSSFPAAPGHIPHAHGIFPLSKGMHGIPVPPNSAAAIPGMIPQRFYLPKPDINSRPLLPPSFMNESLQQPSGVQFSALTKQQTLDKQPRLSISPEKDFVKHAPLPFVKPEIGTPLPPIMQNSVGLPAPLLPPMISSAVVPAPLLPPNLTLAKPFKPEKAEKADKKSKEHKKEKKDKMKKKKEKKEKHKDKGEKVKEKKDKSEKREKLEKIKEKKEKKEKRKEKELSKKVAKEEKVIESVPKITFKLGPAAGGSPRPPTPDNSALMKKITIKPPKKPEDEIKREPTPELAKISALVTRPPKQKSTSKKVEQGLLEAYAAHSSDASFSISTLDPTLRVKKPLIKALPRRDFSPSPPPYESFTAIGNTNLPGSSKFCFTDQNGQTVWICPACGKRDDGSPMIGCDDCDGWYHWICVGIQVAPDENENWYCPLCLTKKKKKKHKKKTKVDA